jgi:hypothetical protein
MVTDVGGIQIFSYIPVLLRASGNKLFFKEAYGMQLFKDSRLKSINHNITITYHGQPLG